MLTEPILAQVIQSYARAGNVSKGKQLHARLIYAGSVPSTFVANHLLNMYTKCDDMDYAISLFDRMPHRNLVTWTAMISGFSQNNRFLEAIRFFSLMQATGIRPTQFALSSAIQAAISLRSWECGKQIHSLSTKLGFDHELFVGSNLANLYSKCGFLGDACRILNEMPDKDEVSWNTMIEGYAKNKDSEALVIFQKLFREGMVAIDQHVFCTVLSACGDLKTIRYGRSIHSCVMKLGFGPEVFVSNALTDMYSKAKDMDSALSVVTMDSRGWNVVSSSSLIDGFIEVNQVDKALNTYIESRRRGIEPNEFTFSSMIKGCADQATIEQGSQLHAQVIKTSFIQDPFVFSVLIDMYGKCGLLDSSIQVFEEIPNLTDITWNSMVNVLAQHGRGKEAIQTFSLMVSGGVRPKGITFVSLLTACSHTGLVEEGLEYFRSMNRTYGVEPKEEHYSCVIDMLGRAGRLKEAEEFIKRMPFEPNAYGWCSLLGACKTYGDRELAEVVAEKLMKLEPDNSGSHIMLSSVYGNAGQWENMKAVRELMWESSVKKQPGFSWVDVNKTRVVAAQA